MSEFLLAFPVLILLITICLGRSIIKELGFPFYIACILSPNLAMATVSVLRWCGVI